MRRDLVIALATAVLAIGYLVATWNLQTVPIGDPLGPRAYPAMIGVGLLIAAAMIFLETRRAVSDPADDSEAPALLPSPKVMVAIAGTLVFILLFEPLGFLLASSLYLLAMTTAFHPGRHRVNAAISVGFTLAAYLLFQHLLGVSLPGGLLSF